MKSVFTAWLLAFGLIASHAGCCSVRMVGDGYGARSCDSGECGSVSCGAPCLPFAGIRSRILGRVASAHCNSGCGEIYWDEHINEPPVCDPCGCNGQFTGDYCQSCPTALGRLRNLWTRHQYFPSSCDTCPAGAQPVHGSTCTTCGSGHAIADHSIHQTSDSNSAIQFSNTKSGQVVQPTPATRPAQAPRPLKQPEPVPDPNASIWDGSSDDRIVVGSGVQGNSSKGTTSKTVVVKPVSSKVQSNGNRPRLTTNPR
ncbi:MAG: hypothetical protein ABL921_14665, partial [Pirellula sp.]